MNRGNSCSVHNKVKRVILSSHYDNRGKMSLPFTPYLSSALNLFIIHIMNKIKI